CSVHAPRATVLPYPTLFRSWACPRRSWHGSSPEPSGARGSADTQEPVDEPRSPSPTAVRRRVLRGGSRGRAHASAPRLRGARTRSEEHTSELQSRENLVCRL